MLKKFSSAALLAAGLLCSLNAFSANYNLGTLADGDNEFGAYIVGTSNFVDRLDFDLASNASFSGGAGSIKVTVGATVKRDISNLGLQIFDSANNLLPTVGGSTTTNLTLASPLTSGHYYALITGQGVGTLGGKYGGVFTLSPAPEPESWAMMVAGLGLVNLVARRKKAKLAAISAA